MRGRGTTVILFLPPYSGPPLGPPAGLLSLAAALRAARYDARIIDAAITPDYLGALGSGLSGALCLGISLLTGPMIGAAVKAALHARNTRPDLPIVFGGWHPTLLPEQTLREDFIDVVVRGQGEITFLEVVRIIEAGGSFDGIPGCSYKTAGTIRHNPDRPAARIDTLPLPAYDLADFDAYESAGGERKLPYATSVGCPYACSYCTDTVFYQRRFNALPALRVIEEVTGLVARYRLREVALLDSNFLVDTRRAIEIARGFLRSNLRFTWTFQASTDLLCRLDDDEVRLLGESGVRHIGFGTESGSEAVLQSMEKHHQRVGDMFEAARKCRLAGIRATFNLILGFPGETEKDRRQTFRVMAAIGRRFDNVTFSPNIFTPYPGIPAWKQLETLGVRQPDSLHAWSDLSLGTSILPWLQGTEYRRIRRSISFFLLHNELTKAARRLNVSRLRRGLLQAAQRPLHWRLENGFFEWPFELILSRANTRLAARRSLVTGRAIGHGLEGSC
jgi:radical SAM superfamily enzyme YgiQ (UPF0313 family)